MRVEELQIGDWVLIPEIKEPVRVTSLCELGIWCYVDMELIGPVSEEHVAPVPLTPEIMEENFYGHKRRRGYLSYTEYELNEDYFIRASAGSIDFCIHYDDSEHDSHDDIYLVELKYVHTMQHTLRLFEIDKEIVL